MERRSWFTTKAALTRTFDAKVGPQEPKGRPFWPETQPSWSVLPEDLRLFWTCPKIWASCTFRAPSFERYCSSFPPFRTHSLHIVSFTEGLCMLWPSVQMLLSKNKWAKPGSDPGFTENLPWSCTCGGALCASFAHMQEVTSQLGRLKFLVFSTCCMYLDGDKGWTGAVDSLRQSCVPVALRMEMLGCESCSDVPAGCKIV